MPNRKYTKSGLRVVVGGVWRRRRLTRDGAKARAAAKLTAGVLRALIEAESPQ